MQPQSIQDQTQNQGRDDFGLDGDSDLKSEDLQLVIGYGQMTF